MRIRYTRDSKGRAVEQAKIYTEEDHKIARSQIDPDARSVTERLRKAGFEGYIVGGAVRDLLMGRTPKDFDIVTDASPNQVRKIFRNSRIIGKRFRLVHVYFPQNKILEVATFRSLEAGNRKNLFGTMDEDVRRRDFSHNALYYSPREGEIIDYVNGYKDINNRKLHSVLPLKTTFEEDPVRMLRAVKYSVSCQAVIPFRLGSKIRRSSSLLGDCSISRISEEIFKILQSGKSEEIFKRCVEYKLFPWLLPGINIYMRSRDFREKFYQSLKNLDSEIKLGVSVSRGRMLAGLTEDALVAGNCFPENTKPVYNDLVQELKNLFKPLIAPNKDVFSAVKYMFKKRNFKIPRNNHYKRRDRHRKNPRAASARNLSEAK